MEELHVLWIWCSFYNIVVWNANGPAMKCMTCARMPIKFIAISHLALISYHPIPHTHTTQQTHIVPPKPPSSFLLWVLHFCPHKRKSSLFFSRRTSQKPPFDVLKNVYWQFFLVEPWIKYIKNQNKKSRDKCYESLHYYQRFLCTPFQKITFFEAIHHNGVIKITKKLHWNVLQLLLRIALESLFLCLII